MRYLIITAIAILAGFSAAAQTMADDAKSWAEGWKYAFSSEGRQNWKPEFTARNYTGFITGGTAVTGGVRIDDKRTLGLMVWYGDTYIDADPSDAYSISAGLYMRRYFHVGKRDVVAIYSDFAIGAGYVYKVDGIINQPPDYSKGDILFAATLQPGIRVRFWKNIHIFLGPTLSTNTIGLHAGVGF